MTGPTEDAIADAVKLALLDDSRRKARVRLDLEILKAAAEARSWLGELSTSDAAEALEETLEHAARRLSDPWGLS